MIFTGDRMANYERMRHELSLRRREIFTWSEPLAHDEASHSLFTKANRMIEYS